MACKGCAGNDGCACSVIGDGGAIEVTGAGTPVTSPYVITFSIEEALDAVTVDDATACEDLNDPHVPTLLGDGSVLMVPLPCFGSSAAQGAIPGQAFAFTWDSGTAGNPGDGEIQFNNGTVSSATIIYVSDEEINGTDISGWLDALDALVSSPKGMFKVYSRSDTTAWASFRLTSGASFATGVWAFTVAYVDHAGSFSDAIPGDIVLDFAPASEGSLGGFNSVQTIRSVTGADTLVLADAGKYLRCANGSSFNLTVPLNSSVAFSIGTHIDIIQSGAGQVTIVATGGVTINATPGLKLTGQWAGATLVKVGTNEWDLVGNLTS